MSDVTMPPMRLDGNIVSVAEVANGVTLAADVAAAATTMTVLDPWNLADTGSLKNDAVSDGSASDGTGGEDIQYTAVDQLTGVVTLAAPLTNAHVSGEWFYSVPLEVERVAYVRLADDDTEAVGARIPTSLNNALPPGQIDNRPATIERIGDEWVLVDLPTSDPTMASTQTIVTGGITVVNEDGETVASIGPDGASFQNLSAENFDSGASLLRNSEDKTLYVDPVNGSDDNTGEALLPFDDTFTRTLASTWGTSDSGHLWTQAQYQGLTSPDVGTPSGAARLRTNGVDQNNSMQSAFTALDAEAFATVSFSAVPTGGSVAGGIGRIPASNGMYVAGFQLVASGSALNLIIEKRVTNTWTTLATLALVTSYFGNRQFNLRVQIQANDDGVSTDIRVKAWEPANPEPEAWMLTANDSQNAEGQQTTNPWGVYNRSFSAGTGTVGFQVYDLSFDVIDSSGQVIDTTTVGVGPLATIERALDEVGQWNDGEVRINLAPSSIGEFEEPINIHGLAGGGRLIIDGAGKAVVNGVISLFGVHQYMEIRDFTLQDTGDTASVGSIDMRVSRHVECVGLKMQAYGRASNIAIGEGSECRVENCQMDGAASNCLNVFDGAMAYAVNNTGAGGSVSSYRCVNSILFVSGTKPTVGTVSTNGGQIFGTTTTNTGGTPAPTTTKKTKTFKCNATKTWRPSWYWKSGDEPIQGSYGGNPNSRGMFYYGTSLAIAGKTCDSIKIRLRRLATGGASSPQSVYLWTHNLKTQSDSGADSNVPNLNEGPVKVGELAWGQTKVFTLPKAWGTDFLSGARRGVGCYVGDGSPYLWLAGRGGNSDQGELTITYH